MRRSRFDHGTAMVMLMAIMCVVFMGKKCDRDKVKKQFRIWNLKAGEALVELNEAWDESYTAASEEIADKVIAEGDPNWTEAEAEAAFKEAMAGLNEHNHRWETAMMAASDGLEAVEQGLDAWEHADQGEMVKALRDVAHAVNELRELLKISGVPIPKIANDVVEGIDGFTAHLGYDDDDPLDD